jgi:hypothetical protein
MLFEFENIYNLDTGDLLQIFYASGVHLQKDVSLSFSFTDPQGKKINNDIELRNNPLIKNIDYDIIDISGNLVYENYSQGLTRTFSLKEIDNIALFGEYKKDFGVRCSVSNFINDSKFISQYYLYGNIPQISGVLINDGSGIRKYSQNLTYEDIGTGAVNDKIQLNIEFLNNPNYILYDYIDIYSSYQGENNDIVEIIDENFIYRYPILNNSQLFRIDITKDFLPPGNHNLAIIPYSKIGSGEAFYIKPVIATETQQVTTQQLPSTTENGNSINPTSDNFIVGTFTSNKDEIIDIIDINTPTIYNIFNYTTKIIDNNKISSSELKIIYNKLDLDEPPSLIEYAINENNFMNYRLELTEENLYLIAGGASEGASYAFYKRSI